MWNTTANVVIHKLEKISNINILSLTDKIMCRKVAAGNSITWLC